MVTKMDILELGRTLKIVFLAHHPSKISGIGMVTENVAPLSLCSPLFIY